MNQWWRKRPPKEIFLQWWPCEECREGRTCEECKAAPEPEDYRTWCVDPVYQRDVKYIRADLAEKGTREATT